MGGKILVIKSIKYILLVILSIGWIKEFFSTNKD